MAHGVNEEPGEDEHQGTKRNPGADCKGLSLHRGGRDAEPPHQAYSVRFLFYVHGFTFYSLWA